MFVLRVINGPYKGQAVQLVQGELLTFGRSPDCTICFDDPQVSGTHAEFDWTENGFSVFDDFSRIAFFQKDAIHAHRLLDVLDLPATQIFVTDVQFALELIKCRAGQVNSIRFTQLLQTCCNIDPIAIDVVALDQYVPEIDPDAEVNVPAFRKLQISFDDRALDGDRGRHSIHHAAKLDQHAITGCFHDAAIVPCNFRIDQFVPHQLECFKGSGFIGFHESREVNHVGSKNCRKTS